MAKHSVRGSAFPSVNKLVAASIFLWLHSTTASPSSPLYTPQLRAARSDEITAAVSVSSNTLASASYASKDYLVLDTNTTLSGGISVGLGDGGESNPPSTGYRAVAYFGNWDIYARNVQPTDVPTDLLTHVIYSFANVKKDTGEVILSDSYADTEKHYPTDSWDDKGNNAYGCVKQFYLLKQKHRNMKFLLSIGGWTYAHENKVFASIANPGWISTFAKTAVQLLKDMAFDGLDIDWEYPENTEQAAGYVKLLQAIRDEMEAYSQTLPEKPHFLLSVASPAGALNYELLDIMKMDQYLDMWNLMSYDYSGAWDKDSGFAGHSSTIFASQQNPKSTPFDSAKPLIYYLDKGVHPGKINLGMPLYGHSFMNTDGPGQKFQSVGKGSWEAGIYDYKVLPLPGAQVYKDESILASWSYDPQTREMISYDTPEIVEIKIEFIKANKLGGGMWWDASGDRPKDDPQSLIALVVKGLGGENGGDMEQIQNVLDYPESKYDNIKSGMKQQKGDGTTTTTTKTPTATAA